MFCCYKGYKDAMVYCCCAIELCSDAMAMRHLVYIHHITHEEARQRLTDAERKARARQRKDATQCEPTRSG